MKIKRGPAFMRRYRFRVDILHKYINAVKIGGRFCFVRKRP